jgi:hypothetical protein
MRPVTALLLAGAIAFTGPALAGSGNPQGFSALQDVRAEQLSEREMASITGQYLSSISSALRAIGEGLATVARKG